MTTRFTGNFTQQLPIPEQGIARAIDVMRSGRLHRYNVVDGETPETVLLEREFASYLGMEYCLACASGGYAMQLALRAVELRANEPVLTNGFTLSPVPGAIAAAGGRAVLVEITDELVIDLDDLKRKCETSQSRLLLLSHMRGHIADMEELLRVTDAAGIQVIEDCAHTMGARWGEANSGTHGAVACFSAQTYKHINSGEGGFVASNDAQLMARATLLSGSYMLYGRHSNVPDTDVFEAVRLETPNCSGRMDNLRAAILRPQLEMLDASVLAWNVRYRALEASLSRSTALRLRSRPDKEHFVGSSIQFIARDLPAQDVSLFLECCLERGVEIKWFGDPQPVAYTSRYDSWQYLEQQSLPQTDAVLSRLFDMRIPLTFSVSDCELIGDIIVECLHDVLGLNTKETTPAIANKRLTDTKEKA